MSDPDIKGRFTPHILDITQALTRLEDEAKPPAGTTTLHWEDPTSPTGRTASPGWTETGTSGGSRIFWKAADSGDLLITAAPTEGIPDTKPPAGDADLIQRIADALKSAGDGCDGHCGLSEQECANEIGIVQEASVTAGGPDEVTWIEGTTTALAQVMLAVRDLEVVELRRSLAISRKRTQHFAALYSEALDELEDIAP